MFKKIIAFLSMGLLVCFLFSACGDSDSQVDPNSTESITSTDKATSEFEDSVSKLDELKNELQGELDALEGQIKDAEISQMESSQLEEFESEMDELINELDKAKKNAEGQN